MILLSVLVNPIRKITILHKKVIIGIYHYYIYIYIYLCVPVWFLITVFMYMFYNFLKVLCFRQLMKQKTSGANTMQRSLLTQLKRSCKPQFPRTFHTFMFSLVWTKGFYMSLITKMNLKAALALMSLEGCSNCQWKICMVSGDMILLRFKRKQLKALSKTGNLLIGQNSFTTRNCICSHLGVACSLKLILWNSYRWVGDWNWHKQFCFCLVLKSQYSDNTVYKCIVYIMFLFDLIKFDSDTCTP